MTKTKKDNIVEYYKKLFVIDIDDHLPLSIHTARQYELIDDFYPGRQFLTDEELLREKYYKSLFEYQEAIAKKRFIEYSKCGFIDDESGKYQFIIKGEGI